MISNIDLFALIYAAISHDMDHPGYNNAYQVRRTGRSVCCCVVFGDATRWTSLCKYHK